MDHPPLERAKFLSIVSGNLDEFFMVRVGKLERKIDLGSKKRDLAGLTPVQRLRKIRKAVCAQVEQQYQILNHQTLPDLAREGILLLSPQELSAPQHRWLSQYFDTQVLPILTPRTINPQHPFPKGAVYRGAPAKRQGGAAPDGAGPGPEGFKAGGAFAHGQWENARHFA
jgi:polyphosphate kinase